MIAARSQAEAYARALPATEPRPPFLLVVDIEHAIDLYAEFTRTGGVYVAFPDARANRVRMDDLADEEVRDQLRRVWADPLSLDPSRRSARVTTDLARKLAALARSLSLRAAMLVYGVQLWGLDRMLEQVEPMEE